MSNQQNPQRSNDEPLQRPVPLDPDWQKGYVPLPPPPVSEPIPGSGYVPLSPPPLEPLTEPAPPPLPLPEPQSPQE